MIMSDRNYWVIYHNEKKMDNTSVAEIGDLEGYSDKDGDEGNKVKKGDLIFFISGVGSTYPKKYIISMIIKVCSIEYGIYNKKPFKHFIYKFSGCKGRIYIEDIDITSNPLCKHIKNITKYFKNGLTLIGMSTACELASYINKHTIHK